ncbi:MAG TPA: M28 family peptidase, partial [Gemmatimonadaceae bacterium]
ARGTTGRAFMFETGDGNYDAVRQLHVAPDVTAGSVSTTVYRALPNDTDLSELAQLGMPALNFAFAGGVERYHTSRDDSTHLNPGSLQHHGTQMLALTKHIADGELPRPKTGDGVFFDMPVLGVVLYPTWVALPLALLALVLTVIVVRPMWRASLAGAVVMLVAIVVVALIARSINLTGPARWSGLYAIAIVLGAAGVNVVLYRLAKRWQPDAWAGALVVFSLLAVVTSALLPSVSYPFTWPLLFALVAARSRHPVAQWFSVAITILILAGFSYLTGAVMLGLGSQGSIALAVLTSLMTWLVMPTLAQAFPPVRGGSVLLFFAPAAVLVVIALGVAIPNPDHPTPTGLLYAENTANNDAWLGTMVRPDDWARTALGTLDTSPGWVSASTPYGSGVLGHSVQRASLEAPTATLVSDSTVNGERRLVIRVQAPRGTASVVMRVTGARVLASSIDGRAVDTTRFRRKSPQWGFQYWAVPDSGALVGLTVASGREVDFDIASRRPGLPTIAGVTIPERPDDVVPAQDGDVSTVYRHARF